MASVPSNPVSAATRLFHLTFYKAGSQWIRDILADARLVEHSGHTLAASGIDLQSSPWPNLRPGQFASPLYSAGAGEWRLVATPEDRAFVVIRDPRDIVVSLVYSVSLSHTPTAITLLLRDPIANASSRNKLQVGMFLLAQWAEYLRSWSRAPEFDNIHLTRYEDLVADLPAELTKLFSFLQWDIPQPVVHAIAQDNDFAIRAGRPAGQENLFSHRRKGVAGDWRNHFNRDLARLFEEAFPGLLTELNYEPVNNWWQTVPTDLPELKPDPVQQHANLLSVLAEFEKELAVTRTAAEERLRDVLILHEAIAERDKAIGAALSRCAELEHQLSHIQTPVLDG